MARNDPRSEANEKNLPTPGVISGQFAAMGQRRIEEFLNARTDLLEKLQELNKQWLERVQSEANLASELASKLTAARSIPDTMTACQEWSNRRFEMMAEDGKHAFADAQKFMETGARLLSNGWWSNGKLGGLSS